MRGSASQKFSANGSPNASRLPLGGAIVLHVLTFIQTGSPTFERRVVTVGGKSSETWQQSWNQLWNYIESLSCESIGTWANAWRCEMLCVPSCAAWPHGLLIIQLPDGGRLGFPLTPEKYANKLKMVRISPAQWQAWTAAWQAQQQAWADVVAHIPHFTATVVPSPVFVASSQ